jgi:hypothetical protein
MFTPFAFVKQEIIPPIPSIVPPYSPFAYYDATNTSFSSASVWNDVVSGGSGNMALKPANGTPTYTSGEYYTFSQASTTNFQLTGSTPLSDFMNNLQSNNHTKIALLFPTSTTEEDFMSGGGTINMILSSTSPAANAVLGYVDTLAAAVRQTNSSISTTTNVYWFGGQRFASSSISVASVDAISGGASSLPVTITNGATGSWSATANGPTRFIAGSRNNPVRAYFDGRIAQMAIYDKALTDSEIQDVCTYMKNRQGL